MDLPTYTNIWRIEKRLYKLYDLRLPMPLPIVWIGVFVGVLVPWWVFLALVGLPFQAPWHVVYLVPPGVLTWLATRPVIEGKRLTELLQSQLRYLAEPRTWCRMAPLGEPEEITFTARVWRSTSPRIVPAAARTTVKVKGKTSGKARAKIVAKEPGPSGERGRVIGRPAAAPAALIPSGRPAAPGTGRPARRGYQGVGRSADAVPSGVVRPAVAAAAAAAAPIADVPSAASWRTASASGRGAVSGERDRAFSAQEAVAPLALEAPRAPEATPASEALDAREMTPAGPPSVDAPASDTPASRTPVSYTGASDARASEAQISDARISEGRVSDAQVSHIGVPDARVEEGRVSDAQVSHIGGSDARVEEVRVPDEPVPDGGPATPVSDAPPIGTEALRRLRRLAASVDGRALPSADPAPRPDGPAGPEEAVEHSIPDHTIPERTTPGRPTAEPQAPEPQTPELQAPESPASQSQALEPRAAETPTIEVQTPTPELRTAAPPAALVETAPSDGPAVTEGEETASEASGDRRPASDEAADRKAAGRQDSDEWQRRAREQHRKGRPPRPMRPEQPRQPTKRPPVHPVPPPIQAVPPARPVTVPPAQPVHAEAAKAAKPASRPEKIAPPKIQSPKTRGEGPPRLRRVEAVVGRDPSGGWRRLAQVVVGGSRTDGMEIDEARARTPLSGSRRIMVLGCTGGAGQTTTALMLGHTLARYREDRVLALDASGGDGTMIERIAAEPERPGSLLEGAGSLTRYLGLGAQTSRCGSGLEVLGADIDDQAAQRLADRASHGDWSRTLAALERCYGLTVIDPAAALAARLLPYADQLVLVAPASADAPEAIAMTYEWLDGHGCSDLRRRGVMVINGVSRRSLPEVEQAESVASGRCRAIVRVPWEDELAPGRPGPVDLNHLRTGGRRAYVALAGVIVSSLAANRPSDTPRVRERTGEKAGE
ncbi:TcpE family conjugal transfer membrane protein [Sphaerimonospora sp. CA-214678]|uniref:TcpE family conjugal transfer membrane protein n=1 Tax=Sphaerimonospora sp. CA-214678 TaxID=3240029 RepID=UPI003D8DD071